MRSPKKNSGKGKAKKNDLPTQKQTILSMFKKQRSISNTTDIPSPGSGICNSSSTSNQTSRDLSGISEQDIVDNVIIIEEPAHTAIDRSSVDPGGGGDGDPDTKGDVISSTKDTRGEEVRRLKGERGKSLASKLSVKQTSKPKADADDLDDFASASTSKHFKDGNSSRRLSLNKGKSKATKALSVVNIGKPSLPSLNTQNVDSNVTQTESQNVNNMLELTESSVISEPLNEVEVGMNEESKDILNYSSKCKDSQTVADTKSSGHTLTIPEDCDSRDCNSTISGDSDNRDRNLTKSGDSSSRIPNFAISGDSLDQFSQESKEAEEAEEYKVPYYLENFLLILETVVNDEFYSHLFNAEDRSTFDRFRGLSENGQKLYVRLFGRQCRWLRQNRIVYHKIADDLTDILGELVIAELLHNESQLEDSNEALRALAAPEVKTLAKSLHMNASLTREKLIEDILKHGKRTNIGTWFRGNQGHTENMILKRAKSLLGACFKLNKLHRSVFLRVAMLFGLHNASGDQDDQGGAQQQIFQMLMTNIGRLKIPTYTIQRKTIIFQDRDSLINFNISLQHEADIMDAIEKKDYDSALKVFDQVRPIYLQIIQEKHITSRDRSLPDFLRVFTSGSVYTRIMSYGVEVYQFTKQYREAVTLLEELITQDVYKTHYRGRWYERLALNLDHHLKQQHKSFETILKALNDPCVRTGRRYTLYLRAKKILSLAKNKKLLEKHGSDVENDEMSSVQTAPTVTIKARQLHHGIGPGAAAMWITNDCYQGDNSDVTFVTRVEDVALAHYRDNGYPQGIHGEGGTFTFLFSLLMWDVIFMDTIPDVFYNKYQFYPLDLRHDHFYTARREAIEAKIGEIRNMDKDTLCTEFSSFYTLHQETQCMGVNWERFTGVEHAVGLVRCIGGDVMAGIFTRMARGIRHVSGGVPDLVVWNPDTEKFKVVEVKGPGDRLSTKQMLWLDYLVNLGVDAETCYVEAIGAKRLRTSVD